MGVAQRLVPRELGARADRKRERLLDVQEQVAPVDHLGDRQDLHLQQPLGQAHDRAGGLAERAELVLGEPGQRAALREDTAR